MDVFIACFLHAIMFYTILILFTYMYIYIYMQYWCISNTASLCIQVQMYVCVCVCFKQSYYPRQHNELVSHISSGKSLDNYTGLSLCLSLPSPAFFLSLFLFANLVFCHYFLNRFARLPHRSPHLYHSICLSAISLVL